MTNSGLTASERPGELRYLQPAGSRKRSACRFGRSGDEGPRPGTKERDGCSLNMWTDLARWASRCLRLSKMHVKILD
jgi:hypothetical protein